MRLTLPSNNLSLLIRLRHRRRLLGNLSFWLVLWSAALHRALTLTLSFFALASMRDVLALCGVDLSLILLSSSQATLKRLVDLRRIPTVECIGISLELLVNLIRVALGKICLNVL